MARERPFGTGSGATGNAQHATATPWRDVRSSFAEVVSPLTISKISMRQKAGMKRSESRNHHGTAWLAFLKIVWENH